MHTALRHTRFAALAAAFLLAACGARTPEDAAKRFVEKSYTGDADAVIAMIYIPEQDKAGIEDILHGKVKAGVAKQKEYADSKGGLAEITADPAETSPDDANRASVKVHMRFKQGETNTDRVRLIKDGNDWKVRL